MIMLSTEIRLVFITVPMDRGSSVGIATRYGLNCRRIESRTRFSAPLQAYPGAHPSFYAVDTGSFPGVKQPGRGVDRPSLSSAGVKKE